MGESLKLYLVECRGMTSAGGGRPAHGRCYVVATDPTQAWERARRDLEERDLGFPHERELGSITLLAEDVPYPECGHRLYLGGTVEPRPCVDCGVLICGGPTRCLYCAGKLSSPAPDPAAASRECTGIAASWCPVHGNCSCPRDEEGVRLENRSGVACPLHGLSSKHGNAEIAAVERASAPEQWLPSGADMADRFGGAE